MSSIYIIGSLRNPKIRDVAKLLRDHGHDVFDDWHAAGERADDNWKDYELQRGRTYKEALKGRFARTAFELDRSNLDRCDVVVMVLPAGKSGHLELGYSAGKGKRAYILFDGETERWDMMYQFATDLFFNPNDLIKALNDTRT